MARKLAKGERPLDWVGSSKKDFLTFPEPVRHEMGNALGLAQFGGKHPKADYRGDAFRAIYTVRFRDVVYVLHAFQKKSPTGIRTGRTDIERVQRRLAIAQGDYEARHGKA